MSVTLALMLFSAPAVSASAVAPASPAPAASTGAAQAPSDYPTDAVLEHFYAVCQDLSTIDAAEAAAHKDGWETYNPAADSQVGQLMSFGLSAARQITSGDDAFKVDSRVLRASVDGHHLDLMLTGVQTAGGYSLGCRMVDFDAPRAMPNALVTAWAKRHWSDAAAGNPIDAPGILTALVWRPGLFPGHEKTQVGFVPQESEMKQTLHVSGINLMTQIRN